jgi:LacI family transcriptional regulator
MKKVTMKDIADSLGISTNAVSMALNDQKGVSAETRRRVLEAADTMGYLDKSFRYAHTFGRRRLCVMIQDIYSMDMGFYGEVLLAINREAGNWSYDTLVQHFNDEKMAIPECISAHRVAGIIVLGKISTPNVEKLQTLGIHMVIIDHVPRRRAVNCIVTDNISGGYLAVSYLIRLGFSRIGFFGDLSYSISNKERYYGFLEALNQGKLISLDHAEDYIQKYSVTGRIEEYMKNMNTEAAIKILSKKKHLPQAYFCANDQTAVTLIHALKEKNIKVPADLSIIGFDNGIMAERVSPKLTTVNVNRELMGKKGVRRLIQLIDKIDEEAEHTILGVELVVRGSVKAPAVLR